MPQTARLLRFVDEELRRAPDVLQEAIDTALASLRRGDADVPFAARAYQSELAHALSTHRRAAIEAYHRALGDGVRADLEQTSVLQPAAETPRRALSLVDETEVTVDVELSRTIQAINDVAEYELRELRAYTSALAGETSVSRETNPFRASVQARALWAAIQALPIVRGYQVALMPLLGQALAKALRLVYAAACTRLEDAGVEPAAFGTIVLPSGSRTRRPSERDPAATDLKALRDSMPVPLDAPVAPLPVLDEALLQAEERLGELPDDAGTQTRVNWMDSHRQRLVSSAGSRLDQQLIELLGRLFDAILVDPRLPAPTQWLISRLQASALRVALRDATVLDRYDHAVWRFMDRLALQTETPLFDAVVLETLQQHARRLIDHMVGSKEPDAALYDWGLQRLAAFEQHQLERRVQAAAPQIDALRREEGRLGHLHDRPIATIDVAALDTVPAKLIEPSGVDEEQRRRGAARWLGQRRPGDLLQVFLQGRWRPMQVLWTTELQEMWLLHELPDVAARPLHRRALERLQVEGLAQDLVPRSLVQAAAERVMRSIVGTTPRPTRT